MKIDAIIKGVEKVSTPLNGWFHKVSMIVLLLLMFLTVGDVVGRYLVGLIPGFGPIPGSFELTEFMLAVIVLTAVGYTQVKGEHISIDLVVEKFPPRVRAVIDTATNLIGLAMFALVTWQTVKYARLLYESNDVSGVLRLPVYPFLIVAAVGCLLFCLAILSNVLRSFKKAVKHEP
jgi:TRAP-type C4-dicarboxylate transport system permease small subunit